MNDLGSINWTRWLLAGFAVAVVLFVTDMVIHGMILMKTYEAHYAFARPDTEMPLWAAIVRLLAGGYIFALIYHLGLRPGSPGWAQGMRYGFWIGLFLWVWYAFLEFTLLPIPFMLVPAWLVMGIVQMVIAGLVVGLIYRPAAPAEGS